MAHPFAKLLEAALKKCTPEYNALLVTAEGFIKKGYRPTEVQAVLLNMMQGRLDDAEVAIIQEAVEELQEYFDVFDGE